MYVGDAWTLGNHPQRCLAEATAVFFFFRPVTLRLNEFRRALAQMLHSIAQPGGFRFLRLQLLDAIRRRSLCASK